jgi:hypothetical protein
MPLILRKLEVFQKFTLPILLLLGMASWKYDIIVTPKIHNLATNIFQKNLISVVVHGLSCPE